MNTHKSYLIVILIGLLIYEISGLLSIFINFAQYIKMLGAFVFILGYFKSDRYPLKHFSSAFSILLLLTAFLLIRGSIIGNFYFNYETGISNNTPYLCIRHFLTHPNSGLAFLLPFLFTIKMTPKDYDIFKKASYLCCFFVLLSLSFYSDIILSANNDLGMTSLETEDGYIKIHDFVDSIFIGFGLILYISFSLKYISGWKQWIFPLILIVYFLLAILGGSRGATITGFLYLIIFFYTFYKYSNIEHALLNRLLILLIIACVVYLFYHLYNSSFIFDFLLKRLDKGETLADNNRTFYVNHFLSDFNSDILAWIFGRGVNGSYSIGSSTRTALEWGYLWLVLKGGVLYLVTYVYILLKAGIRGVFKSNNMMCRAFGILILFQVYSLLPFGLPTVNVFFALVWLGVGFLNNQEFLTLSDEQIICKLK